MRIYRIAQSTTIGPVYHGTPYAFKLEEMTSNSAGIKFFSDKPEFARDYASQKSFERKMDATPKVLAAYIKGNVFDPQNEQHINAIIPYLPKEITVYNDFGMDAKLPLERWKEMISGVYTERPYWSEVDLRGKKVGDALPENDTYGKPLKYEIIRLTSDKVYYTYLGFLSEIINGRYAFRWDAENIRAKNYSKEEVANDLLDLEWISFIKKYGAMQMNNRPYIMNRTRHAVTTKNNDVWRWLEGEGVFEAIRKASFNIVKSREKGQITYAVFPSVEIIPISSR